MDPAAFLASLRHIQDGIRDVLHRHEAIHAKVDAQIKQLGESTSSKDNLSNTPGTALVAASATTAVPAAKVNQHVDPLLQSLSDSVSSHSAALPKLDLQQAEGRRQKANGTLQPPGAADGVPVPVAPPTISSVRRASARSSLITPIRRGAPSFGNVVAAVMKKKQLEDGATPTGTTSATNVFRRVKTTTEHVKRTPPSRTAAAVDGNGQQPQPGGASWDMSRRLQELEDIRATNNQAMVRQTSGFSRTHSLRQLRAASEEYAAGAASTAPQPVSFSNQRKKVVPTVAPVSTVGGARKKVAAPPPGDHRVSSPASSPSKSRATTQKSVQNGASPAPAASSSHVEPRSGKDASSAPKIRLSTNKVAAKTPRKYAAKIVEGVLLQQKQAKMLLADSKDTHSPGSSPLKKAGSPTKAVVTASRPKPLAPKQPTPSPAAAAAKQPWQSTTKLVTEDKRVPVLRRK